MYIDGFIVPVPKKKLKAYRSFAKKFGKMWIDAGALEYNEYIADDVKKGKVTSFPQSVKMKSGETVFFSWAKYRNKAHRNKVMNKVMKNPQMNAMEPGDWPFDGMRMIYGGFKGFVKMK